MHTASQDQLSDRYDIEREVGVGATARVYLARDIRHERRVALKILRPELAGSVTHERFLREIRVAAGLQHPNILPLYDSGQTGHSLYFVMPFMEGDSLREHMTRTARMTLVDAVAIVREVADALSFAHERGVVHRDVKPENIILGGGHAFVCDFGIAQALTMATRSVGGDDRLTGGGRVVGTLPYMSPEQLSGDEVDGRSDQYSLACVFFEMLTGQLPHGGITPTQVMAHRMHKKPKRIRQHRKDVSRRVDAVLARALAPDPAKRFASARAFADELSSVALTSSVEVKRQRLVSWLGGAASVAVAVAAINWYRTPDPVPLDPSLYAVLPFAHDDAAARFLGGDHCQLLLSNAFSHWRGVRLVNQMQANSAYEEVVGRGVRPTLDQILDAARRVRAASAAWGSVRAVGDSVYVTAALYDVASGESIREWQVAIPAGLDGMSAKFRQLADTLLLHVAGAPATADAVGTQSIDAWRAYAEGHRALAEWDLPAAQGGFTKATELDPDFAHAWLWLVQSINWSRLFARADWRDAAARLVAVSEKLPPSEREFARALLELAEGRFQDACGRYRAIVAVDSTNFSAWFGLGECQSLDRLLVQDRASPSGWRFRASQHSAIEAYRRALSLTPSTYMAFRGRAFDRLQSLLFTNPMQFKRGFIVRGNDTTIMGAFPALVADTLAFTPYTMAQLFEFDQVRPPTLEAAVARNRTILQGITQSWTRAFPRSADATEAHGRSLELVGALTSPASDNARRRFMRARALTTDADQRTRLAVAEVRVLLKSRDFAAAGRLADSIAAATPAADADHPGARAAMAALGGRFRLAADLSAQGAADYTLYLPSGRLLRPPLAVGAAAMRVEIYAAFGASSDTLRALSDQLRREIERWLPPADRAEPTRVVLENVAALGFEQLGPGAYHDSSTLWLAGVQRMALRGDRRALTASLDSLVTDDLANARSVFHGARMALRVGDSARATAALDNFIAGLPADGDHLLVDPTEVAPITRILALRAQLAQGRDAARARQMAAAVLALWRRPDPELADVLRDMRQINGMR